MTASYANELDKFLQESKKAFLSDLTSGKSLDGWVIVNGNEAGGPSSSSSSPHSSLVFGTHNKRIYPTDLDSLVCAVGYAYFTTHVLSPPKRERYIPLLLTPSNRLLLRPENQLVLKSANIPESSLLTISDIPSDSLKSLDVAGFVLVDHNRLLPIFDESSQVFGVVDHHADEGKHLDASPRLIEPVGSCSSLVTSLFEASIKSLITSSSSSTTLTTAVPSPLADLLISAMLIDTGLKPTPEGKATPTDISSCDFLVPFSTVGSNNLLPGGTSLALKELRKKLAEAKADVGYLSITDLLERDYKDYRSTIGGIKYGISSVPVGMGLMLAKKGWEGFLKEVKDYTLKEGLEFEIILTSFEGKLKGVKGKQHLRELFFYINETPASDVPLHSIWEGIEGSALDLGDWADDDGKVVKGKGEAGVKGDAWRVWQQRNAKATRKQVAPIVAEILAELEKGVAKA